MVSILPNQRTPYDILGPQIGSALQQVLPGAVQQGYQRQIGHNAIDRLQQDLASANGDISKILPALARAYTDNPNLERSGIGQLALNQAQKNTASSPVLSAIGGQQGMGGMAGGAAQQAAQPQQMQQPQQAQQAQQPISENKTGQGLFLNNFIPQDIGELITPEQKTNMLSEVAKKGGDVGFTRQLIEDYNQGKIGFNELSNSNVEKQAANVQRMLGFEDQIKKKIDDYIPLKTPEAEKNIYYNMLRPALEGSSSFSDAWQKVAGDIDNFRKLNEAYVSRIPEAQITGVSPAAEQQLRNSAKPIMKIDPLAYNTLEASFVEKGHSPITPAQILKPLPSSVKGTLSKATDYRDLVYNAPVGGDFPERVMERNMEHASRGQQQEIPKMANSLRKEWNEDLSLLNIYTELRKKGWSLPNINTLLDDVSDQFGSRQQAERAMLNNNIRIPTRYLSD